MGVYELLGHGVCTNEWVHESMGVNVYLYSCIGLRMTRVIIDKTLIGKWYSDLHDCYRIL